MHAFFDHDEEEAPEVPSSSEEAYICECASTMLYQGANMSLLRAILSILNL